MAFAFLNCKAQYIEVNSNDINHAGKNGYYYKDIENNFNNFEGEWLFSNGNESLTIILQKKIEKLVQNQFFNHKEDVVVGEYRYIKNGIEQINTLPNILINLADIHDYNINGTSIFKYGDNGCYTCSLGDVILHCSYNEPNCDLPMSAKMIFKHTIEDGVEKLYLTFAGGPVTAMDINGTPPTCEWFKIPFGEYELIKQ